MPTPALELREVEKEFHGRKVVDRVSISVEPGEFFTILGPSGCGKSTLLRLVNGIEVPDAGRVFIAGQDVTELPPYKRDVHTVFQDYALFPHLDVQGNVEFGLKLKGVARAERRTRVAEVLETVGLPGFERKPVDKLSGGERQRVALARAIVLKPPVLLLDEPLSALDLKLRRRMADFLAELKEHLKLTMMYVTHDQEEAFELSTRIAIAKGGKIVQCGTPRELYDHPATEFAAAFLGEVNLMRGALEPAAAAVGAGATAGAGGSGAGGGTFQTEGGLAIPLAGDGAGAGAARRPTLLGVRPEHVLLANAAGKGALEGADVTLRGHVRRVRFSGSRTSYFVDLGSGEEIRAVAGNPRGGAGAGGAALPREGDAVLVGWAAGSQIFLSDG